MRPERLTMKGFGAFSTLQAVDFAGVELFALTGPTGSGKTTVLDGICFALYGSVPRHRRGEVAPVVTQGLNEAVVSLDFLVGEQQHRVIRHVRRLKGKTATTDEATLERSGEVLAMGADAVTDAVKVLLGLDFEQFTTCVLLPQGEFQRFLHDKPADRQNLLSALLDLGIYERIGQRAGQRHSKAEGLLSHIDSQLAAIPIASPEEEDSARLRLANLTVLLSEVEAAQPEISQLELSTREAKSEAESMVRWQGMLSVLSPPAGLDSLATDRLELFEEKGQTQAAFDDAQAKLTAAELLISTMPTTQQVRQWAGAWRDLEQHRFDIAEASEALVLTRTELDVVAAALEEARLANNQAGDQHRAAHLRASLVKGRPCPVCEQSVRSLPQALDEPEVEKARAALELTEANHLKSTQSLQAAEVTLHRLEERGQGLQRLVEGSPLKAEVADLADRIEAAGSAREVARALLDDLKRRVGDIEQRQKALSDRERSILLSLNTARDQVAALQPPALELDDPVRDWKTFAVWAESKGVELETNRATAAARTQDLESRLQARIDEIRARFEEAGVKLERRPPRDAAVDAVTTANAQFVQIQRYREEATRLQDERATAVATRDVAALLTRLLRNDAFRNWLLDEVFAALVTGANQSLGDLTKGQYSLAMSGRDFEVIDNFNAGNRRSVKTLSGGETFLVSLALALSLADQVAESSMGTAQLDSIFLDEGFGTLDADTLEVVANVISELGASGKMVGIVTHVAELAEQMPKRYEVRKGATTATIDEVSV